MATQKRMADGTTAQQVVGTGTAADGSPVTPISYPDQPANDAALFLDSEGGTVEFAVGALTTNDISQFSHGIIHFTSAGAGTIAVTGLIDGTQTTAALRVADSAQTNSTTLIQATALAKDTTYYIRNLAVKNLVFTASTANCVVYLGLKA